MPWAWRWPSGSTRRSTAWAARRTTIRTRLIGTLLGRGYGIDEALAELKGVTLESLVIIGRINKAVKKLAQDGKLDAAEFPLLMHMDAIIEGKATSEEIPWERFTN